MLFTCRKARKTWRTSESPTKATWVCLPFLAAKLSKHRTTSSFPNSLILLPP